MESLVLLLMSLPLLVAAAPKDPSMLTISKLSSPASYKEMPSENVKLSIPPTHVASKLNSPPTYHEISSENTKLLLPPTYFTGDPNYSEGPSENVNITPDNWSILRFPSAIVTHGPNMLPLLAGQPNLSPASLTSMFTIPGPCGFRGCGPHGSGSPPSVMFSPCGFRGCGPHGGGSPPFVFTVNPPANNVDNRNEGVNIATLPLFAVPGPCGFHGCGPHGSGSPPFMFMINPLGGGNVEGIQGTTLPLLAVPGPCGFRGCGPHGSGSPPF